MSECLGSRPDCRIYVHALRSACVFHLSVALYLLSLLLYTTWCLSHSPWFVLAEVSGGSSSSLLVIHPLLLLLSSRLCQVEKTALVKASCQVRTHGIVCEWSNEPGWATTSWCDTDTGSRQHRQRIYLCLGNSILCAEWSHTSPVHTRDIGRVDKKTKVLYPSFICYIWLFHIRSFYNWWSQWAKRLFYLSSALLPCLIFTILSIFLSLKKISCFHQ